MRKLGHCKVIDNFSLCLLCADSLRTTKIIKAVQKDMCFPILLWLLENAPFVVRLLLQILSFTPDDGALPLLPNPHTPSNSSWCYKEGEFKKKILQER